MALMSAVMLDQFAAAERERQARIERGWRRYHGEWPDPLRPTRSDPRGEDNIRLNFARLIVDKGAGFLFRGEPRLEVDGDGDGEADRWLARCWEANRKMTTLHRLAVNGGVCGHAFLRVRRQPGAEFPRVVVPDPAHVSVRWEADDFEEVTAYHLHWHGVDPKTARPVAFRQVLERDGDRWLITDQESRGDDAAWVDRGPPEVWPFAWPPLFGCQNLPCPNEWWGLSDLEEDLLRINQAINFVASNVARILRLHAHPKTWGKGFQASELSIGVDETIVLPDPSSELQNLEMKSDLASSLELFRELRGTLHELARVPEVATGKVEDLGQLSGLALQILYGPLVELTETKRLLYGELLQEVSRRLLELGGFGTNHRVRVYWPEVLPRDPRGEAETARLYAELGVSRETLLARLGFDPEAEARRSG
ncbi:MAG: phage portal protein [Armatimonadota bacterium]